MSYSKHKQYVKYYVKILLLLSILCVFVGLQVKPISARMRERHVKSERQFDKLLSHAELAVVMFYEKNAGVRRHERKSPDSVALHKEVRADAERLEYMFSTVSRTSRYREAGVFFLTINCAYDALNALASRYGITQFPSFVLFEDGIRVKDNGKSTTLASDTVSSEQLREFIDTYLNQHIEDIIEDKAEARERAIERNLYYWGGWGYPSYPYYYWNYPYYGYGYRWWW
jgi:hypothetical protein